MLFLHFFVMNTEMVRMSGIEHFDVKKNNGVERHVVLIAPDVHWNTGNIGRTCIGADAYLHLIQPLGFSIDSREVKRAGLDYWHKVKLSVWDNFASFVDKMKPGKKEMAYFTKNGKTSFWELNAPRRLFLVFGSETKGIPKDILDTYEGSTYHIPILREIRCLNLSTSVGIALFESLRFSGLRHEWL